MKLKLKWLAGLALAFVIAMTLAGGVSAADKWTASPDTVVAADFCADPDDYAWYQVHHWNYANGLPDFAGATVACSGWAAIHQVAVVHGYPSVDAAAADGWAAGNRNQSWVSALPDIGEY